MTTRSRRQSEYDYDDDDDDDEAAEASAAAAAAAAAFAVGTPSTGGLGTSPSLQRAASAADRFLHSQHTRSGSHRGSLRIMQEVNLHQHQPFPSYHPRSPSTTTSGENFNVVGGGGGGGPQPYQQPPSSPRLSLPLLPNLTTATATATSIPAPPHTAATNPLETSGEALGQTPTTMKTTKTDSYYHHTAPPPAAAAAAAAGLGPAGLDPTGSASMRRAARELLGMAGNRSKRSIFDPRLSVDGSVSTTTSGTATIGGGGGGIGSLLNDTTTANDVHVDNRLIGHDGDSDDYNDADDGGGGSDYGLEGLLEYWFPGQNTKDDNDTTPEGKNDVEDDERGRLLLSVENGVTKHYDSVPSSSTPVGESTINGDNKPRKNAPENEARRSSGKKNEMIASSTNNNYVQAFIQQASAVAIIGLLNMMVAIPFGASYFPVGWKSDGESSGPGDDDDDDDDDVHGSFPIPGKEALGLRMFLFATMIAQLVFAFKSKFVNAVGLQMVENVPFLHALASTVIRRQGYGKDALSTLFFLFGLSSVIVGIVFYLLGRMKLGKVVYFFPQHVLVGCIGGIGVFILLTAVEVTTNTTFDPLDLDSWRSLIGNFYLLWVVLAFEGTLRLLMWVTQDKHGRPKFQLLSPLFYIMITPIFYIGLWVYGISIDDARGMGYFFPSPVSKNLDGSSVGIFQDPRMWDIFTLIDLRSVSWTAVLESTGTMIALAAFSLIHVPINIPAFGVSTDVEVEMNAELIAHGWSNGISGIFGGLQNYMTYSNSVLYAKTGGKGLASSLSIAVLTAGLFVVGPKLCDYLPRCMAGTLLIHIGIDLALEGVFDSWGQYDLLEYAGIWLITVVMTVWGMTAGLIAGVISALSTYAVQSINYQNPIRQILTATTLRSSAWTRCAKSREILEDERTGRSRILIFQLSGHLFFGNVAQLTDTIKDVLKVKTDENDLPIIVIVDFTLVNGMDSSAAHAVAKLKKILHRLFGVPVSIFVTGSDRGGFPCEFALTEALSPTILPINEDTMEEDEQDLGWDDVQEQQPPGFDRTTSRQMPAHLSTHVKPHATPRAASQVLMQQVDGRVFESLDDALRFAEDILIARADPNHQFTGDSIDDLDHLCGENGSPEVMINLTLDEERFRAKKYMKQFFAGEISEQFLNKAVDIFLSKMTREEYRRDDILWEQGSDSDSMKIIVSGELVSVIEETGASEPVMRSNFVGELGLIQGTKRLTTLVCSTERAILYSLSAEEWRKLKVSQPHVASLVDGVVIRYLAHRVQHVNNRYFHTTLPC